ncbi:interleukin-5 receptor subunit alpha isoform X2 [Microcaecilia unicolor]|uniref:Interleukin-5 receptor subunit alpha-like isoform X2 n=1 Tax=Microcaecilia unicolor TaxID=1415580 RepID=A0A6P7Y5E9_9AMPH|nr:interleukin-5 receptor subunit alpha-like isoform X2 [Microcaecilia unicolor]
METLWLNFKMIPTFRALNSKHSCFMEPVISSTVLLILGLTMWKIFPSASLASTEQNIILSSPNVTIKKYGSGYVVLTWDSKLTKDMENFAAKYVFCYQYLNLKRWYSEITERNFARIVLKSHLGFNFKICTQLKNKRGIHVAESAWAEYNYQVPAGPVHNLSCIVYNISNLKCTWEIKPESPEELQFFFSYRYRRDLFQCQQYLTNAKKKNIGCDMKDVHFNATIGERPRIRATVSVKDSEVQLNWSFLPLHIEILTPPINISVSTGKENARFQWNPPATIGSKDKSCFLYEVKLKQSDKEAHVRYAEIENEEYLFPDYDGNKRYSFQVRAKKNCIKNKHWGEWSELVFIGEGGKAIVQPWLVVLIGFFSIMSIGSLIGFLCKRYKVFNLLFTPVPEPSHKITNWLISESTHLQNNALVQTEAVTTTEVVTATGDS